VPELRVNYGEILLHADVNFEQQTGTLESFVIIIIMCFNYCIIYIYIYIYMLLHKNSDSAFHFLLFVKNKLFRTVFTHTQKKKYEQNNFMLTIQFCHYLNSDFYC